MSLRTLIHMDAPDHPVYRHLAADWFLPKSLAASTTGSPSWRSATSTAWPIWAASATSSETLPCTTRCYVILSILGLPEDDFPRLLKLTPRAVRRRRPGDGARHDARGAHADDPGLLPVLRRADRGPARPPHGRPGVGHRERGGQRRADRHLRGRQLLRDHGDRGTRHDLVVHLRRIARAPRASGPAATTAATTRRSSPPQSTR